VYFSNALILSGNNNWPPIIDLIGGFLCKKVTFFSDYLNI